MKNNSAELSLSYSPELVLKLVSRLLEFGYKPEEVEALLTSDILGRMKHEIRILPKFELVKIVSVEQVPRFTIGSLQRICRIEPDFLKMFEKVCEPESGPVRITCYRSVAHSPSCIASISLLGGYERAIVSLGQIQALMELQSPSQKGVLCDRNWNVFHVHGWPDRNTVERVVVGKDGDFDRWSIDVHACSDERLWMGNTRFFGLC